MSVYVIVPTARGLRIFTEYQYITKPRPVKTPPKKRLIGMLLVIQPTFLKVNGERHKAAIKTWEKATFRPPSSFDIGAP